MKSLLIIALTFLVFKFGVLKQTYNNKNYELHKNITTLFVGDSHTQYGISDIGEKNYINLGYRSEKYIWTYNKLKKILESNSQLKKVFLSVSLHSFGAANHRALKGDKLTFFLSRYCQLIDADAIVNLLKISRFQSDIFYCALKKGIGFPFEGFNDFRYLISLKSGKRTRDVFPFWGAFNNTDKKLNKLDLDIKPTLKRHFDKNRFSPIQEKYFNKIIQLCYENNIEINLISFPVTQKYLQNVPKIFVKKFEQMIELATPRVSSHINLINSFRNTGDFKDFDHLNKFGALKVSELLKRRVK